MKKAFVISWYFPPINSSEGLVTFKLLKNSKYKYDVFTQKGNLSWTYGDREERLVSDNITPIFSESSDVNKWVQEGVEFFKKNHEKYEYIMSRAMAPESHVMALEIKKLFPDIKWIASFGDPIGNNPFITFCRKKSPYTIKGKLERGEVGFRYLLSPKRMVKNSLWKYKTKRYLKKHDTSKKDIKLEKDVIDNADVIILNNKYQFEYMSKANELLKEKAVILNHSFDYDFYPKNKDKKESKKIVFSFLGHLDGIRSPKQLLEAIKRLKESNENLSDKVEFDFYGNMADDDKLYIINNYLTDVVHFKKSVDYFKSLEIMKNSDWVINIDANLGTILSSNIFFAAKIADYLGSGTPIFCITLNDGASADILRETGDIVSSYSSDEIYLYLLRIINNDLKVNKNKKAVEKYNAKEVAKEFDKVVEKMIKEK